MDINWDKWTGTPWLKNNTIFLTRTGSHSYGTNIASSDLDIKGVCIPPIKYFYGFLNKFEQAESKNPDIVIYNIRKFFELATDCNPNIIEFLYVDENDIIFANDIWNKIKYNRIHFLSQKAKHTFSGYAVAQLKRIKSHKNHILNPVENKPIRKDYGLPPESTIEKEQYGFFESKIKKIEDGLGGKGWTKDKVENLNEDLVVQVAKEVDLNPNLIPILIAERKYRSAMRNYDSYQKWKLERNEKRSELERKFGYDTKHAMHLVRLMRMAKEILTDGKVLVKRPDAEELLAIRNGAWTYEQLIEWAERTEADLNLIQSPLPHSPDTVKIDELLVNIINERFTDSYW